MTHEHADRDRTEPPSVVAHLDRDLVEAFGPQNAWPTPQQFLNRLDSLTADERLERAARILTDLQQASRCFVVNHEGENERLWSEVRRLRVLLGEPKATDMTVGAPVANPLHGTPDRGAAHTVPSDPSSRTPADLRVEVERLRAKVQQARVETMDFLHGKDRPGGLDGRFAGPVGLVRALIACAEAAERALAAERAKVARVEALCEGARSVWGVPMVDVHLIRTALASPEPEATDARP